MRNFVVTEGCNRKIVALEQEFTDKLIAHLENSLLPGPLTYGFEYEFIPESPMTLEQVNEIKQALPEMGFTVQADGSFKSEDGLDVSFEPGGQLEYGSPPLLADDIKFMDLINHLTEINRIIAERFGVQYLAMAYAPGRESDPLCIDGTRYLDMHAFFTDNGGRGREMMKSTASIQLHVRLRSLDEVVPLFKVFSCLAQNPDFAMSETRRAIWDATDVSRCLLPQITEVDEVKGLLTHLVSHALKALDFSRRVPFYALEKPSFERFLVHLTTMFTDVRLNLKGPTFELRTMDSLPLEEFKQRWHYFIREVERAI
jgi:glutamate--cysteine ligase